MDQKMSDIETKKRRDEKKLKVFHRENLIPAIIIYKDLRWIQ